RSPCSRLERKSARPDPFNARRQAIRFALGRPDARRRILRGAVERAFPCRSSEGGLSAEYPAPLDDVVPRAERAASAFRVTSPIALRYVTTLGRRAGAGRSFAAGESVLRLAPS